MIRQSDKVESSGNFLLEKHYVDLVTAEGLYFIGYSARLILGSIRLGYSATLHHPEMSGIIEGPVLSARDAPTADESTLNWHCPRLGFDGQWQPLVAAETVILHETNNGLVEWNCQQPAARAHVKTASGLTYSGLGYAELLNLTMPPWQLGLQTLYWGRYVSDKYSVVWIEWQGDHALTVLICNGQRISDARISNNEVSCDDFQLTLDCKTTIRMGSIGETFVAKIPSALKTNPIEFLGGREQKYLSRGRLKIIGGSDYEGWVIHERVSWR
jgi:hypothetical protein